MAPRTEALAKTIDQTLLDEQARPEDVESICRRAAEVHLASLCVLPKDVRTAFEELRGSDVKVCAVIGFPTGAKTSAGKIAQAERALVEGAAELEFVVNTAALRSGDVRLVRDELVSFARSIRMKSANGGRGLVLRAILGTHRLDDKLKQLACRMVEHAEMDFAQTSTGYEPVSIRDVELLRDTLPESVGVKAAGSLETLDDVETLINAGAGRIGSTIAVDLLARSAALAPV
jgi:deoxyribose-phosphate aldolase